LATSEDQLAAALDALTLGSPKHPYPFDSNAAAAAEGRVSVYNSKEIFSQYCATVLGSSVRPDIELYRYRTDPTAFPQRKVLMEVRYPTSDGWKTVSGADFRKFWKGQDMRKVFAADRCKNKTSSDREEMAFIYVVVVGLRENGLLDRHNRPDPSLLSTRQECVLRGDPEGQGGISIGNVVFQPCERRGPQSQPPPHYPNQQPTPQQQQPTLQYPESELDIEGVNSARKRRALQQDDFSSLTNGTDTDMNSQFADPPSYYRTG
jgi:hypothetical protein